jgi:hypothetical protein
MAVVLKSELVKTFTKFIGEGNWLFRPDAFVLVDRLATALSRSILLGRELKLMSRWVDAWAAAVAAVVSDPPTVRGMTADGRAESRAGRLARFKELAAHMGSKGLEIDDQYFPAILPSAYREDDIAYAACVPIVVAAVKPSPFGLHLAAQGFAARREVLVGFFAAGLDINGEEGWLMQHALRDRGNAELIDFLLEHGADPVLALRARMGSARLIDALKAQLAGGGSPAA